MGCRKQEEKTEDDEKMRTEYPLHRKATVGGHASDHWDGLFILCLGIYHDYTKLSFLSSVS